MLYRPSDGIQQVSSCLATLIGGFGKNLSTIFRVFSRSSPARATFLAAVGFGQAFALAIASPTPLYAQERSAEADPAIIERRIPQQPTPPKADPAIPQPREDRPALPPEPEETFVLSAVVIEGATVFAQQEFIEIYEPYLARALTLSEIAQIPELITEKYREAGFVLSRARIVPQGLVAGVLTVEVLESYVVRVLIEGPAAEELDWSGYTEPVVAERPLTLATLERMILLINDLPGFSVRDSRMLRDEENLREFYLTVEVDYKPLDGLLYLDNRGTSQVGSTQGYTALGANNWMGRRDRLQFAGFTVPEKPEELGFVSLRYEQPLGSDGLLLYGQPSITRVQPTRQDRDEREVSRSVRVIGGLRYPVIRSREESLFVEGRIDFRDTREKTDGRTTERDELRVARLEGRYLRSDPLDGFNVLELEASAGFPILGASDNLDEKRSRRDADAEFTKVKAELRRVQSLPLGFSLLTAGEGQLAGDELLSSEEFSVGGARFGRAFDGSEITGDHGLAALLELRRDFAIDKDEAFSVQLYGFYDWGAIWNRNRPGNGRELLASAGFGLRFGLWRSLNGDLQLAAPVSGDGAQESRKGEQFFFSLTTTF